YVAYTANDQGETSIYFTQSQGGGSFGSWSTPVRVHTHGTEDVYYFDPEVSVDNEGTIVITYSLMVPAPFTTNGGARATVAWSTDGGMSFANSDLVGWNALALPYHCGRQKWFLGEYRQVSKVGGRAIHLYQYQSGSSSTHVQKAR